jgi:hypothetical protein
MQKAKTNGLATTSLVMGILAILFNLIFIPSILAIVFGIKSRKQIAATGEGGAGMALAGLILGIVGAVLYLAVVVLVFVAAGHSTTG